MKGLLADINVIGYVESLVEATDNSDVPGPARLSVITAVESPESEGKALGLVPFRSSRPLVVIDRPPVPRAATWFNMSVPAVTDVPPE